MQTTHENVLIENFWLMMFAENEDGESPLDSLIYHDNGESLLKLLRRDLFADYVDWDKLMTKVYQFLNLNPQEYPIAKIESLRQAFEARRVANKVSDNTETMFGRKRKVDEHESKRARIEVNAIADYSDAERMEEDTLFSSPRG